MSRQFCACLACSRCSGVCSARAKRIRDPAAVVILSALTWRRHFRGDPAIVGRTLKLDGKDYEVVGILPDEFAYPDRTTQFWIPVALQPVTGPVARARAPMLARLADGVSIQSAAAEVDDDPSSRRSRRLAVRPRSRPGHDGGAGEKAAARADGHGRRRAPHRLRQRREPVAGPYRLAPTGNRDTCGARCRTRPRDPASPDRECAARGGRRSSGNRARRWAACACCERSRRRSLAGIWDCRRPFRGSTKSPSTCRCWPLPLPPRSRQAFSAASRPRFGTRPPIRLTL